MGRITDSVCSQLFDRDANENRDTGRPAQGPACLFRVGKAGVAAGAGGNTAEKPIAFARMPARCLRRGQGGQKRVQGFDGPAVGPAIDEARAEMALKGGNGKSSILVIFARDL